LFLFSQNVKYYQFMWIFRCQLHAFPIGMRVKKTVRGKEVNKISHAPASRRTGRGKSEWNLSFLWTLIFIDSFTFFCFFSSSLVPGSSHVYFAKTTHRSFSMTYIRDRNIELSISLWFSYTRCLAMSIINPSRSFFQQVHKTTIYVPCLCWIWCESMKNSLGHKKENQTVFCHFPSTLTCSDTCIQTCKSVNYKSVNWLTSSRIALQIRISIYICNFIFSMPIAN
jgi:hypothetical protein